MAYTLTDTEIMDLLEEGKPLPEKYRDRLHPKRKSAYQHEERELKVDTPSGHSFRVIIRRNSLNILDFSIILSYYDETSNTWLRLVRYNGKHPSLHTNKIERNSFHDFHIHKATERYQLGDYPIDGYAEVTHSYTTFEEALTAFLKDCHFESPSSHQRSLFEWGGVENGY